MGQNMAYHALVTLGKGRRVRQELSTGHLSSEPAADADAAEHGVRDEEQKLQGPPA